MTISRRSFFGVLAGGIALAATGVPTFIAAETPPAFNSVPKRLRARHIWQYSLIDDQVMHRIDVIIAGNQYTVDFASDTATPSDVEIEPALIVLGNHLRHEHAEDYEFDIRSFTLEQVHSGESNHWFGRIGEPS